MNKLEKHWDRIYRETEDARLGWYEDDPAPMMQLLEQVPDWKNRRIFLPGAGTSILVDRLLESGARLVLNDLSPAALGLLQERLGDRGQEAEWICQNMADPLSAGVMDVDLWIDRAVLHFLPEEDDIRGYFSNVLHTLKIGGYILFAEFPPDGVLQCASLELHGYSLQELQERLGDGFSRIDSFDHTFINPDGDVRPYIYAMFKRIA